MAPIQLRRILVTFSVCLIAIDDCWSGQIRFYKFSKRPTNDVSMRNTTQVLLSITNRRHCAARCSEDSLCSVFVYSSSQTTCQLGFSAVYERNHLYLPDYTLYKTDADFYTEVSCSSGGFANNTCSTGTPKAVRLFLLHQLSNTTCVLGDNYGLTADNQIWVAGGCRAIFGAGVQ